MEAVLVSHSFGKPLALHPALRYAKHHDQQADDRPEHRRSVTQFLQLDQKLDPFSRRAVIRDGIENVPLDPPQQGSATGCRARYSSVPRSRSVAAPK